MSHSLHRLISSLKTGQQQRLLLVSCPSSKIVINVLSVLHDHGFINGFRFSAHSPYYVDIFLKRHNHSPVISNIAAVSKSGNRMYKSIKNLSYTQSFHSNSSLGHLIRSHANSPFSSDHSQSPVTFMNGVYILSTSHGIISHFTAHKLNIGGEILLHVI